MELLPSVKKSAAKSLDKNDETRSDEIVDDPLTVGTDPLSTSLASDPLTAALIDPLAVTSNTSSGTSGIFDATQVSFTAYTICVLLAIGG